MNIDVREFVAPTIEVYYGKTGSGKSRRAREEMKDQPYYVKTALTGQWWDGYEGEENVIWDDFRGDDITYNHLLVLLDGYGARVQVKGGTRWLKVKRWIITSRQEPKQWYHIADDGIDQLLRRITSITKF